MKMDNATQCGPENSNSNFTYVYVQFTVGISINHIPHFQCLQQRREERPISIISGDDLSISPLWLDFLLNQFAVAISFGPSAIMNDVIVHLLLIDEMANDPNEAVFPNHCNTTKSRVIVQSANRIEYLLAAK